MPFLRKQESGYIDGLDSASKPALSKAEWVQPKDPNAPNSIETIAAQKKELDKSS